jgi:tetratricopeptide (TPR) repeat protein
VQTTLAERYIQRDSLAQAQDLLSSVAGTSGLDEEQQNRISAINLHLLHIRNDSTAWLSAIDSVKVPDAYADKKLFWRARSYEKTRQYAQAENYYSQALKRLPTDADVVKYASHFYATIRRNPERAYEISLTSIQLNPLSPELLKVYILQCLEMRLITYAEESMDKLLYLVGPTDYQLFQQVYEAKKASVENMFSDWK